jgi:hypothetical protein
MVSRIQMKSAGLYRPRAPHEGRQRQPLSAELPRTPMAAAQSEELQVPPTVLGLSLSH